MTTTTERYTAEQIATMAASAMNNDMPVLAAMLRQAATDATRLQTLEAENARYRAALERIVSDSEVCPLDTADAETYAAIARNAMKGY